MRKVATIALLAVVVLLATVAPSLAGGRHFNHGRFHGGPRVFVGFGPVWWGPSYYPYYYPPYYAYPPPAVVYEQPPVYVQQEPAAPAPPAQPQAYWYYCGSSKAYYPSVQTCTEQWIKVPPRQE